MIEAQKVWKTYKISKTKVNAVKGISFKIKPGEFVFITNLNIEYINKQDKVHQIKEEVIHNIKN